LICGGGGSESSSSNATTTSNIDRRQVVDSNGVGVSSDSSTITINNTTADPQVIHDTLDTIKNNDAVNGAGFTQLLGLTDKLLTGAGQIITNTQDATMKQIDAVNSAANDAKGAIDQKTLIIIGAGVVALYAINKRKK
jgi:hypothetical protein